MNTNNSPDWAWPALIQSLQHDISKLRDHVDEARREAAAAREIHRREIEGLIDQLREVKSHLEPIVEERKAARNSRRDIASDWTKKGGWLMILGLLAAVWHYVSNHVMGGK